MKVLQYADMSEWPLRQIANLDERVLVFTKIKYLISLKWHFVR